MEWNVCVRVKLSEATSELSEKAGVYDDQRRERTGSVRGALFLSTEYTGIEADDEAGAIDIVKAICRSEFGKEPDEIYIGDFDAMDNQRAVA